jgi:hypothetical protein
MSCISLGFLQQLLIWLVIIIAVVALLKLLIPWVISQLGFDGGIILRAIDIVVWALIAIVVIYFVFALISCLLGMGGGLPHLPSR